MKNIKIDFTFVVLFLLLVFLAYSALFSPPKRYGDTSTYYMITQSMIHDFDIKYEEKDLARVLQKPFEDVPAGLFLIKNHADGSYYFAKEYLYSLLSVPFVVFLDANGFIFFNAIMLWIMIYLTYKFVSERSDKNVAILFSLLFFIFSLPFVYTYWVTPDLFCMFLVFLSYYFWFMKKDGSTMLILNKRIKKKDLHEIIACILIGAATYQQLFCMFLATGFFIDKILNRDLRGFIRSAFFFALPPLLLFGTYYTMTGGFHSHSGDRYIYVNNYPFTGNCSFDNECGVKAFSLDRNSISYDGGRFSLLESIKTFPQSLFNYFFGRYTGIMLYNFPIILCLISISKIDRKHLLILISALLFIGYYALVQQTNYAGLTQAVGIRYFYAYPIFIFLVDRVKIDKKFFIVSSIILILGFPLAVSPNIVSNRPDLNTRNFPYNLFPLELPAIPFLMGTITHNSTSYYFDGGFYLPEKEGLWLEGKSSGTVFVVLKGQDEVNFSINLSTYSCPVNSEVSTDRDKKTVSLSASDMKMVVIESHPVFYIYSLDESVHAIKISSDNGCRPSEYIMTHENSSGEENYKNLDKRYLGVFVRYPIRIGN